MCGQGPADAEGGRSPAKAGGRCSQRCLNIRAQGYHRGTGQCGKDHHSLPAFIILVIDSTDRDRLRTTREELYQMLAHEALQDASVLIFANKQDMKNSMTTVEISQFLTLSAIKDHPWHIQGCCAVTGEGIWLTLSSWAQSGEHAPTAEMLWERDHSRLRTQVPGDFRQVSPRNHTFLAVSLPFPPQPTSIVCAGLLPAGLQWMKSQATAN
ncbi:putative ADP-ribosylation factor-like protein 5C isoform X10 [Ailuropoda melanoleuca]|uniref:putative ADP-ribosylation factor-like protein 5C isoform X10 n=1 Tax=Ailuropoda melanoleuca TaxID=9646 RepID=UPI001493E89E|nr:putative ADP-ribosylation factor-like protein 5C isoform X10 [Ailuropoda melanoleuca]